VTPGDVSAEVMGSRQYAGVHLATQLFVVLGHEGGGAVHAALDAKLRGGRNRSRIQALLGVIQPGLEDFDLGLEPNVRWSLRQLRATPEVAEREAEGVRKLVGAVYELETGRVRLLA
jgi:carbonic anhydrase